MPTKIKIPLRSLNENMLWGLQEKYQEAKISMELHQDKKQAPLSEAGFWKIISRQVFAMCNRKDSGSHNCYFLIDNFPGSATN